MQTIRIIETEYNGYRFRSRLEARWAVFFDTLGVPYAYEKEGYESGGIRYLPDFWLREQDCWVEIKGQTPIGEEIEKARMLALGTRKTVFILFGDLQPFRFESIPLRSLEESRRLFEVTGEYHPLTALKYHGALGHRIRYSNGETYLSDTFYHFTDCPDCGKVEIVQHGLTSKLSCGCHAIYRQKTIDRRIHGYFNRNAEVPDEHITVEIATEDADNRKRYNSVRLVKAYLTARQARFEYGQTPQPVSISAKYDLHTIVGEPSEKSPTNVSVEVGSTELTLIDWNNVKE